MLEAITGYDKIVARLDLIEARQIRLINDSCKNRHQIDALWSDLGDLGDQVTENEQTLVSVADDLVDNVTKLRTETEDLDRWVTLIDNDVSDHSQAISALYEYVGPIKVLPDIPTLDSDFVVPEPVEYKPTWSENERMMGRAEVKRQFVKTEQRRNPFTGVEYSVEVFSA